MPIVNPVDAPSTNTVSAVKTMFTVPDPGTPDTRTVSAVGGMKRAPLTSDPGINTVSAVKTMNRISRINSVDTCTVGAANTGGDSIFSLIAGTALVAVGTAAVMTAAASAPISGPLAAAGGVAMGFGVSKLPN